MSVAVFFFFFFSEPIPLQITVLPLAFGIGFAAAVVLGEIGGNGQIKCVADGRMGKYCDSDQSQLFILSSTFLFPLSMQCVLLYKVGGSIKRERGGALTPDASPPPPTGSAP